jgi:hypothetical protein
LEPSSRSRVGWILRELAELGDRVHDLVLCARENVGCTWIGMGSFEAERERQCHQPLLRSVVEVALDAEALGVGRGDHPTAGRSYLR